MSEKPGGSQNREKMSEVEIAWKDITDRLKPPPTMVFSIIGDSDSFVPRPWAKSVFQTALIEAAKSGGDSWIIYRGFDYGVSSIVLDAYQKYGDMEFRAKNREKPMEDEERKVKLISIAGKTTSPIATQTTKKKDEEKEDMLIEDIEETGQEKDKHCMTPEERTAFLLDFEEHVSKQKVPFLSQTIDLKLPIPIILLACEGDIQMIEHIDEALERKIPVIIIKGSGKAADLILDYIENKECLQRKAGILFGIRFEDASFNSLEKRLEHIATASNMIGVFDVNSDDPLMLSNIVGELIVSYWAAGKIFRKSDASVKKPLETHRDNTLYIPPRNGSVHIGTTVSGRQLRKSNAVMPEQEDIEKAYCENRESSAYVLDTKYSSPTSLPLRFYFEYQFLQELGMLKEYGHMLLFEALITNRCDYIRVLLDQGVRFRLSNLSELYEKTVSCKRCNFEKDDCLHIQWILKQIAEKRAKELCFSHRQISREIEEQKSKQQNLVTELKDCRDQKKIKKYEYKIKRKTEIIEKLSNKLDSFTKDDDKQKRVAESARGLCRSILGYKGTDEKEDNKDLEGKTDKNGKEIASCVKTSDILLWAIYANRTEIAEICWLRSENHLFTGLICAAVLRKLSKKANNVKEQNLSTRFADHAKLFEDRCLAIMDGMYEEDDKNAIELMDDDVTAWGIKSSPLTFAHENFMYDVVAHTCSQKNMNKRWYNNLAPDLWPFLKSMCRKKKKFIQAPLTKYTFNYVLFFSMLVFYSAFVLTSIGDEFYTLDKAKVFEYYVYFWGAGDLIEEIISFSGHLESKGRSRRGIWTRLKRYVTDFWNLVDLLSYVLLITALFVRHFHPSTKFTIARRMFSLSLLVMYLRFLEVFLVHRRMGPTLIMIKEMLKDLLYFLVLAVFVVLGVGMYYHANLWPDHPTIWSGNWINWRIWTIIYYPYWQLYGEINNELLEGKDLSSCTQNETIWKEDTSQDRCPQEDWTVIAVAGFYMLFSNLLLVNLVIAMFSYTFERVQENAEKLWRFHRCTVINDYEQRIPSPLNLIYLIYRIFCCPGRKGCCEDKIKECYNRKKRQEQKEKEEKEREYRIDLQRNTAFKIFNKM